MKVLVDTHARDPWNSSNVVFFKKKTADYKIAFENAVAVLEGEVIFVVTHTQIDRYTMETEL